MSSDRITTKSLLKGINQSVTGGHNAVNNKNVNVIGGNPKIRVNKRIRNTLTRTEEDAYIRGNQQVEQLTQRQAAQNLFLAQNNTMAGYRTAKTYRGNSVYPWNPSDFRPSMVGGGLKSGAFMGGFTSEALQMNPGGYAGAVGSSLGHPLPGINESGIAIRGVNPFPITIPTRIATLH